VVLTDQSSSDSDADLAKVESKNGFMRLLAMSRMKHEVRQYIGETVDDTDTRLLHGVYQDKVLTTKEVKKEPNTIIDKILAAKETAKKLNYEQSKKKKERKRSKRRNETKTRSVSDFDGIKDVSDFLREEKKTEEVDQNSFVIQPVGGINRKGLKQGAPIMMLTPTGGGTKKNFFDTVSEEVDNPVIIAGGG